jgi:hypothetical protein
MRTSGFIVGVSAGLIFALLFVAGVSLLGPSASHIDLVHAITQTATPSNGVSPTTGQSSGMATTQTVTQNVAAPQVPFSSLSALSTEHGAMIGLLLLPVLLGAFVGALFYGAFTRRSEPE